MESPEKAPAELNPAPVAADAVRGRRQLLLVALAFASPLLIAMLLRGVGWEPIASRNFGELVEPPLPIRDIPLTLDNGDAYIWQPPDAKFHLLVRQHDACDEACSDFADLLRRTWVSQGRYAERLDLFWFGQPPREDARFRHWIGLQPSTQLEQVLSDAGLGDAKLLVVDPNGFVMLSYEEGYDPSGLRMDIKRLLR